MNPETKRRRVSRSYKEIRTLTALEATSENAAQVASIKRALLVWSGLMLEISPGFMGRLYRAVADEWINEVRGVLYEGYSEKDPRDVAFVALNSVVLGELWKAQSLTATDENDAAMKVRARFDGSPRGNQNRDYALRWGAKLFRSLADSAANELSKEVRMPKTYLPSYDDEPDDTDETPDRDVVDLNCWRQSRPRPLKGLSQGPA